MPSNLPYPVFGIVYDTDGSTAINGATVRVRNETNNEIISGLTDSSGQYILEAANFASGYLETDKLTVYVIYSNLDASGTLEISNNEHEKNLTLAVIADSSLINYCTIQDIFDELDITETDLTAQRIVKVIQRAESRINEKTQTTFTSTAVTEYYDFNQYNSVKSPEQMFYLGTTSRRDYWNTNFNNKFKLKQFPIVSITSLAKNTSSASQTDSWTALTEQSGSGGDFEVDKVTGWVTFMTNIPRYGQRAIRVIYVYGYAVVPKQVERLTILLAVSDIIRMKASNASFNNSENITISELSISNASGSVSLYLKNLKDEIKEAWEDVGTLIAEMV